MWTHIFAISIIIGLYALFFLGGIKHIRDLENKGEDNEPK